MTRGHKAASVKTYCRLDTRKYFSQRTLNTWNKLSHDCVNFSSVNMLKNKIDSIWRGRITRRLNVYYF